MANRIAGFGGQFRVAQAAVSSAIRLIGKSPGLASEAFCGNTNPATGYRAIKRSKVKNREMVDRQKPNNLEHRLLKMKWNQVVNSWETVTTLRYRRGTFTFFWSTRSLRKPSLS
jgi:hypothetical protein